MTIEKMAYEGDIVSRLRNWRGLHLAHGGQLSQPDHISDAGNMVTDAEIDRLRNLLERLK